MMILIPEEKIIKKWRLQPGKMFLIDTEQGRIIDDAELDNCQIVCLINSG
jgi:glutamate synthase (NADPH/NADH) large chain